MSGLKQRSWFHISALAIVGILGILTILLIGQGMEEARADTLYVDDDGGADFETINSALENASNGDIIMIHPGNYEEELEIYKEVTFRSTTGDPEDVVVHKAGGYSIFRIYANNVTISGITIQYGTYTVFLVSADGCLIENNIIKGSGNIGVLVDGNYNDGASNNTIRGNNITYAGQYGAQIGSEGGYNTIENNMFYECGDGLWIYFTAFETVRNNTIMNSDGRGLTIHQSNYCTITNNTIVDNMWIGLSMSYSSYNMLRENSISGSEYNIDFLGTAVPDFEHDIDDSNTVDGRPIYFWVGRDNETVPTDAGFVGIVKSQNITVEDLTLNHNGECVLFVSTTYSTIREVSISFSEYGIHLFFSDHNTIVGGRVWECDKAGVYVKDSHYDTINGIDASDGGYNFCDGIYIMDSDYTTVISCRVNENWGKGIMLISSSFCTVSMNEVSENRRSGIWLVTGNFNRIENNTVTENGDNGIYLGSSPKWNHIANNTCSGNGDNMNEGGIHFDSGSGNTAIHNNVSSNKASGFYFNYGSGNLVTENNVQFNTGRAGFYLSRFAEANTITHNNVSNNVKGFVLSQASGNFIDNNSIFNSGMNGILITDGDQNTITSNFFVNTSNSYGIHLESSCQDNLIYNNYVDNEMNAFDDGITNLWNTSKQRGTTIVDGPYLGGNFWGNYSGMDGNSDWIGDSPQPIDGRDNEDLLPLMLKPTIRVNFNWDPKNPLEDEEVQFTDLSKPGEYALTNWHWDFDDGSTSDEQEPKHTFVTAGTYEVELEVRNQNGDMKSATKLVFVKLPGPIFAQNVQTGERFSSIQEAVNDTDTLNGHVIEVDPGTYIESVWVGKEVTIRSSTGDYNDTTLTPASARNPVFMVTADRVTISGFTIAQTGMTLGYEVGIILNTSDESHVIDNFIHSHGVGIDLISCRNTTVERNLLWNNSNYGILMTIDGISDHESEHNVISENRLYGSGDWGAYNGIGLAVEYSDSCTIRDNIIANLAIGLWMRTGNDLISISHNSIFDYSEKGIWIGMEGDWLPGNSHIMITNNILGVKGEHSFFSENKVNGIEIDHLTIGSLYPTTISFTYNGSIGINSQNTAITKIHPHKENLRSYVNLVSYTEGAWILLRVYYPDALLPILDVSSIRLHTIETYGAEIPWELLTDENGLSMVEGYVWANITSWGDEVPSRVWQYSVFGEPKYDLDFGDSGHVTIDFGHTGELNLSYEKWENPGGEDEDSIDIYLNITQDGPGELDWVNITIDLSDNSFVDDGDDFLIFYWNETEEEWIAVEHSGYDRDTRTVWANLSHLTVFAPRIYWEGPDTSPPIIVHTPITEIWNPGTMTVVTTITDDRRVTGAKVFVRSGGDGTWQVVNMTTAGQTGSFTATISYHWLVDDIEYYIWATDGTNEVTYPEDHNKPIVIEGEFGDGTDEGVEAVIIVGLVLLFVVFVIVIPLKTGMIGGSKEVPQVKKDPGQQLKDDIEALRDKPDKDPKPETKVDEESSKE